MNKKTANEVYDVLVEECGAKEVERLHFVHVQTHEFVREWRFGGGLGFGGKFWCQETGEMYVNCYSEDKTPERDAMVEAANRRLKGVGKGWLRKLRLRWAKEAQ